MTHDSDKLLEQLRRHATDAPDRVAVREIATGRMMTYAEFRQAVSG